MLKRSATFAIKCNKVSCRKPQNVVCYKSIFSQSNMTNNNSILTRSDFSFYEKLLPVDSIEDLISSINFVFDIPFPVLCITLPFAIKSLIIMPIYIYQQRKYELRLNTLAMAAYEICKITHNEMALRKRGILSDGDNHLLNRKQIHNKYGYNASITQLLPYTAIIIQIPIHLTMWFALNTLNALHTLPMNTLHTSINIPILISISIGCTMCVAQYLICKNNRKYSLNSLNYPYPSTVSIGIVSTVFITYLSLYHWTMYFNIYALSNLSSYIIIQQLLINNDRFRNIIGLNTPFNKLKINIRKLQIIYECIRLSKKDDLEKRHKYMQNGGDYKSSFPILSANSFQKKWINLLKNEQNFKNTNVTKNELDLILNNIGIIEQTQLEFTDRNSIQNTNLLKSFLMSPKEGNKQKESNEQNIDFDGQEQYYQQVKVEDVDIKKRPRKR